MAAKRTGGGHCIDSFRHPIQAQFLRDLLRENGIQADIVSQKGLSAIGARMASNHAVMVPPEQAEEAHALLASLEAQPLEEHELAQVDLRDGELLETCPNCGSEAIERRERALFGLPFLRKRVVYICRACDWDSRPR